MVASPRLQMVASTSNAAALVEVRHAPSAAALVRDSLVQMVASPRLPHLAELRGTSGGAARTARARGTSSFTTFQGPYL